MVNTKDRIQENLKSWDFYKTFRKEGKLSDVIASIEYACVFIKEGKLIGAGTYLCRAEKALRNINPHADSQDIEGFRIEFNKCLDDLESIEF